MMIIDMSSQPPSPHLELIPSSTSALSMVSYASEDPEWQPILESSNQVVLYNPSSHALTVTNTTTTAAAPHSHPRHSPVQDGSDDQLCPFCRRPMSPLGNPPQHNTDAREHARVPNYFHLLAAANEMSTPATPAPQQGHAFDHNTMAQGYFQAFFREVRRLGMGANGTVILCEHVLDGNPLGFYAVKKIAVGDSHDYLLGTLREVRLLEQLRHPNIVTYHHAWLESSKFSSFAEPIPTLFILMQWAEGGSLDEFINSRLGHTASHPPHNARSSTNSDDDGDSRSARIRAFRAQRQGLGGGTPGPPRETKAVHLLSGEELRSLFGDVTTGLSFLHDKGVLHLDLKPGNVLLTFDEGALIPRAMLSDFGTSQDMLNTGRTRSGNTGTLEYTAPECLNAMRSVDSKADMWSLGMILYKLLFFRLPWIHDDMVELEREVDEYKGFRADNDIIQACMRRGLPPAILVLLQSLLDTNPQKRPACAHVLSAMMSGKLDPVPSTTSDRLPVVVRRSPEFSRPRSKSRVAQEPRVPMSPPTKTKSRPSSPAEDLCLAVMEALEYRRAARLPTYTDTHKVDRLVDCELEEEALILALLKVRERRQGLEEAGGLKTPPVGYLAIEDDSL